MTPKPNDWEKVAGDVINSFRDPKDNKFQALMSVDFLNGLMIGFAKELRQAYNAGIEVSAGIAEDISSITDYPHYQYTSDAIATKIREAKE